MEKIELNHSTIERQRDRDQWPILSVYCYLSVYRGMKAGAMLPVSPCLTKPGS